MGTRVQDARIMRGTEMESNERGILIEGAIMGLGRNLVLGKFPEFNKDDPS